MITLFLLSIVFVGIALIGLSVNMLVKKNGKFPETSISKNKELRKRKIYCMKTEQKLIDNLSDDLDCDGGSCCSSW